ncbi:MAG: S8/S53 family peptidase [Bacteroidota bacterium]
MRNIQKLIAFVLVFVVCACTQDDVFETSNNKEVTNFAKSGGGLTSVPGNMPVYSQNELVVRYKPGTPETMKYMIRETHGVDGDNFAIQPSFGSYQVCRCNNQDVEKWIYIVGSISIEPKKQVVSGTIGGEAYGLADVDYNFVVDFEFDSPIVGTAADDFYESYIKTGNSGITIAILDTGVATGLTVFNTGTAAENRFLYNASETAIGEEQSGYDFVDDDVNAFDDDLNKHGSIIADQIHSELESLDIAHQILPIKIADSNGTIEYFDMVCGFVYAAERADIINASFGWYDDSFGDFGATILEDMIAMFPNVIVVTSAGNSSFNSDTVAHYPSSFDVDNLISVGACNYGHGKVAGFSNYGSGVDFFTRGEDIPFNTSAVHGTSFAAPYITIEVAKILASGTDSDLPMATRVAMLGYPASEDFKTVIDPFTEEEVVKYSFYDLYILVAE